VLHAHTHSCTPHTAPRQIYALSGIRYTHTRAHVRVHTHARARTNTEGTYSLPTERAAQHSARVHLCPPHSTASSHAPVALLPSKATSMSSTSLAFDSGLGDGGAAAEGACWEAAGRSVGMLRRRGTNSAAIGMELSICQASWSVRAYRHRRQEGPAVNPVRWACARGEACPRHDHHGDEHVVGKTFTHLVFAVVAQRG
jgi:hypothetical protein